MRANPILDELRHRIGSLENNQRRSSNSIPVADEVDRSLPHGGLPAGCIHEVKGAGLASAICFSAILSARATADQGHIVYIAPDRSLHPLGLLPYGVKLDQILHLSIRRPQDLIWAAMETLRCSQVSAMIAVLDNLDLTESRRLQLAAETSGATGFLLGHSTSAPIASPITRWKISSVIGKPGQRFEEPVWALDLLYCRGGRPGNWTVEWNGQKLNTIPTPAVQRPAYEALAG